MSYFQINKKLSHMCSSRNGSCWLTVNSYSFWITSKMVNIFPDQLDRLSLILKAEVWIWFLALFSLRERQESKCFKLSWKIFVFSGIFLSLKRFKGLNHGAFGKDFHDTRHYEFQWKKLWKLIFMVFNKIQTLKTVE